MKALLVSSGLFSPRIRAMRKARARIDTLLASRREDKALRGRNLSAHPEAGHAEEPPGGFFAPEMFGTKAKNPKLLLGGKSPFADRSSNRSFSCFA